MNPGQSQPPQAVDPLKGLVTNDFEKRLAEIFLLFDEIGNRSVELKEVPAIIRGLGCVPTEEEVNEIVESLEDYKKSGYVQLAKFLPLVGGYIAEYQMQPASAEQLMEAFRKLDKENKGYLTPSFLEEVLTTEGEPLSPKELKRMLKHAVDPDSGQITYEYYINQLVVNIEPNIYSIIPPPPPEEPKKR